jgi:multiple sugar transport system permease protein
LSNSQSIQSGATFAARPVSAYRRKAARLRQLRIWSGVATCVLFLLPIAWMILTSLKQQRDIFTTPPTIFFTPTLETYITYLTKHDLPARMLNTLIVAGGSGLISIIVGAMAGYALARIKLRGAATIGVVILLSRGVPPIALAVPMFLVARALGLLDHHITLILAYCTFLIPYVMWLMRGFFKALPEELEEAAKIDGCTRFGAFLRIIVPISLPGLLSTLILAWEELLFALVLTNRAASTVPVVVSGISGDTQNGANWGALTAVATMTFIPVVIFALLVQKWLIKGLADGATKG